MSGPRPSAWVLNFDAENELFARGHAPESAAMRARQGTLVKSLGALIGPRDVVLGETDRVARGVYAGRAWCPTPRAIERLARALATPVPAPHVDVLRAVNHRKFCADLGQTLPGARYVTTLEELLDVIGGASPTGEWLLKRPFGFAGRGRRKVHRGALEDAARTWVLASLRDGEGLQVEPWVTRAGDYALHGYISENGAVTLGRVTQQACDDAGAWRGTSCETDLDPAETRAITGETTATAAALTKAGYFGPFGVDAFRFQSGNGHDLALNARCEINARYSMGWAVGMGSSRPDLASG